MAKELLIVEEPIVCDMCWLSVQKVRGVYCRYKHRYNEEHKKPIWCPLKPLPNKKPVSYHDDLLGEVEKNFNNIGWNDCIDAITGEQNGNI